MKGWLKPFLYILSVVYKLIISTASRKYGLHYCIPHCLLLKIIIYELRVNTIALKNLPHMIHKEPVFGSISTLGLLIFVQNNLD